MEIEYGGVSRFGERGRLGRDMVRRCRDLRWIGLARMRGEVVVFGGGCGFVVFLRTGGLLSLAPYRKRAKNTQGQCNSGRAVRRERGGTW